MKKGLSILKYEDTLFLIKSELKKGKLKVEYKKLERDDENILKDKKLFFSLEAKDGFLIGMKFPFKDRKKIELVLKNELDSLIPFPVDEMAVDFKDMGKGDVITLSVQRSIVDSVSKNYNPYLITNNVLSALFALFYFNVIKEKDFAILYAEHNIFTILTYKNGVFVSIQQTYVQKTGFVEKIKECIHEKEIKTIYLLVYKLTVKEHEDIQKNLDIKLIIPEGKDFFESNGYPEWVWAGAGISLLSIYKPKNEINLLTKEKEQTLFKTYALSMLAFFSISAFLVFLLLYIDYHLKNKAYKDLASEEIKIYRRIFPGSPPVNQIEKILNEKVKETPSEGRADATYSSPVILLGKISKNIDPSMDLKLNDFNLDEKGFSISGVTLSFSDVEKIKESISNIPNIKEAVIDVIEPSGSQVKFKIRGIV